MVESAAVKLAPRRGPAVKNTEWLTLLPPASRFAFHGDATARAALRAAWGVPFSEEPLRAHTVASRASLWLGPDEYLLLDWAPGARATSEASAGASERTPQTPPAAADAIFGTLESALAGIPHGLVDISHRQFAIELTGSHAATILSGACPLDLDLAEFPIGMCTRTVFAKADIVLWRTGATTFHVEVWRSFASYVTGILAEIATEFHPSSSGASAAR